MYSVTTSKTAAAQYATYEQKDNETPRISTTSDYASEVYSTGPRPTPRELALPPSDYQNQLQFQQQRLYGDQYNFQRQQQAQLYQQQLEQQSIEQTRQIPTFVATAEEPLANRPPPFGSENSTRRSTLQSSMKKAASILPSFTSKVHVAGTPTKMENMNGFGAQPNTDYLNRSNASSLRALYGPPRFESSGDKSNSIWRRFFPNRGNDAVETEPGKPVPAIYWCYVCMGGVCLLVLILLIVLLIARMNVGREGAGVYGGGAGGYGSRWY